MSSKVFRSKHEPPRADLSWGEKWEGPDKGLITCWEVGKRLASQQPDLAKRAKNNELPVLGWKGGVETKLKTKEKIGTLFYLAQWQGLRGEDLDIDLDEEPVLTCSHTGMKVRFTGDLEKYGSA